MHPNLIRYEAQMMATRLRLPTITYDKIMNMLKESRLMATATQMKSSLYERAIGQHVPKTENPHPNPTRFGDFEVKGRTSDF